MADFVLPDLGEGLTGAEIVRWMVAVGDHVALDQPVAEVETAKATVELPCPYAGRVAALCASEGDTVPVGHPLLTVATEQANGSGPVLVGYGMGGPRPARRCGPVPVISPVVRQLAVRHGVDLTALAGSGPNGLILRSDVERAVGGIGPASGAPRIPLRGRLGTAAALFERSRREIPDATCWLDVDATGLVVAGHELRIGVSALLARICVAGLAEYPQLNASVDGERREIIRWPEVHLGVAVQAPDGLVVPVVRRANHLSTALLAAELDRLTTAARAGTLSPADLSGGTFTVNNYGALGVDGATPILYHPQAAMLGVGRIARRPWVDGEELTVRQTVTLSLTFDHRVCDGWDAAGMLRFVADHVAGPQFSAGRLH